MINFIIPILEHSRLRVSPSARATHVSAPVGPRAQRAGLAQPSGLVQRGRRRRVTELSRQRKYPAFCQRNNGSSRWAVTNGFAAASHSQNTGRERTKKNIKKFYRHLFSIFIFFMYVFLEMCNSLYVCAFILSFTV